MVFSLFTRAVPTLSQTGPANHKQIHALSKEHITIGRASEADIVIDDPYLAPVHVRLETDKTGTITIRRMGLNPVLLRGEAMLQTAVLKPGDVFRLGRDIEFELVLKSPKKTPKITDDKSKTIGSTKPFIKRPEVLAGMGLVYLLALGGGAYALFGQGDGVDRPSPARIAAEADRISSCVQSARKLKSLWEPGFKGAVGTAATIGAPYVKLASDSEPSDPAALKSIVAPIAEAYRSAMLAGLDAETRLNFSQARQMYQRGFDLVPDIQCSAARYAMTRRAASVKPTR